MNLLLITFIVLLLSIVNSKDLTYYNLEKRKTYILMEHLISFLREEQKVLFKETLLMERRQAYEIL